MKFLIISKATLCEMVGTVVNPAVWMPLPADEIIRKHKLLICRHANFIHISSIKDVENGQPNPLIINISAIEAQPSQIYRSIFQRIDKSAEILASPNNTLPPNWRSYHAGNRVSFFAVGNDLPIRWVTEVYGDPRPHIIYRGLTTDDNQINLNTVQNDPLITSSAFRSIDAAKSIFLNEIKSELSKHGGVIAQGVTLLNDIGSKIVARNKSFDDWQESLTTAQKNFVQDQRKEPLSIYGPAGSGKTLCLALYAISKSQDPSCKPKICFLTQNWSQAYMIDSLIQVLNGGLDDCIHVYPLLYVIRSVFQDSKNENPDYRILIEDSVDGKTQNFGYVKNAIKETISSDLPLLAKGLSNALKVRIEGASLDAKVLNALTWDVMNEFASVLSVNRIRPGITAAARYRALPRANWMMPLQSSEDKDFILAAYSRYTRKLESEKIISYDQIISDYISKFDTFEWDRRRSSEGYDIIVIDEYHLYTDIERNIIPYLYSDPNTYPRLVMAADPMQSPTDILKGIEFAGKEPAKNRDAKGIQFQVFKRYSREIEVFVTHLYNSYPTLLSNDRLVIDGYSSAVSVSKPTLRVHQSRDEAIQRITRNLGFREQKEQATHAVICLNIDDLKELESGWDEAHVAAIFIKDPSDFNLIKYSSRRIIASYPEMTAGLQFNEVSVLITNWSEGDKGGLNLFSSRINITRLYISASRATSHLAIHYVADSGSIPAVLQSAVDQQLLMIENN